ncbi:dUTP diphosphatase [bacterium]|nr:dUTP diphosphatase [bacterium]MCK4326719.1 dUTP diphosphatase [bacterium]MCK4437133.1 dUTP diphosphatase [bacterium]
MTKVKVKIRQLAGNEDLPLPVYMSQGASGMDLYAAVDADSEVSVKPGEIMLIPTGIQVAIPVGFEGQIRPRSGLALKHGLSIVNSPGTVDSDYRGEVAVILINQGEQPFSIKRGDRISQLVISPVTHAELEIVEELENTSRNQRGFGHTGT